MLSGHHSTVPGGGCQEPMSLCLPRCLSRRSYAAQAYGSVLGRARAGVSTARDGTGGTWASGLLRIWLQAWAARSLTTRPEAAERSAARQASTARSDSSGVMTVGRFPSRMQRTK